MMKLKANLYKLDLQFKNRFLKEILNLLMYLTRKIINC